VATKCGKTPFERSLSQTAEGQRLEEKLSPSLENYDNSLLMETGINEIQKDPKCNVMIVRACISKTNALPEGRGRSGKRSTGCKVLNAI